LPQDHHTAGRANTSPLPQPSFSPPNHGCPSLHLVYTFVGKQLLRKVDDGQPARLLRAAEPLSDMSPGW